MRTYSVFVYSLFVIAVIGSPMLSSAQERQMGGVGITVLTDRNFRGNSSTFRQDVSDLEPLGRNDKISSIRVEKSCFFAEAGHAAAEVRIVQ